MVLQFFKLHRKKIIGYTVFLAAMAVLLNAFIQWRVGMPDFINNNPSLFFAGSILLFLLLVIAYGLFSNPYLGTCVVFACAVLLTYADNTKIALRMEHVFPGDLEMFFHLNELSGMYDAGDALPQWFIAGAIIVAGILVTILINKKSESSGQLWRRILSRVSIIAVGSALMLLATWPIRSPVAGDIPVIGYNYIAWNQTMNYEYNGFVVSFVSNLKSVEMQEPEGYSEEAVKDIVETYTKISTIKNDFRSDIEDIGVDVVYIMNESFSDPDRFTEYYPWEGPVAELMPELHRIRNLSADGWVYSPRYGGGTANIEYEVLTGFSTYFTGWAYPYQSIIPEMESFPSIAGLFDDAGYHTIGLHPYGATMYRRNTVYPLFGYDEFHGSDEFSNTARDRSSYYISDASAYREVVSFLSDNSENKFITLITMQNHPQYGKQFEDHSFRSLAYDVLYSDRKRIEDYMELIHSSDAATGDFIDWVSSRGKRTVVVFWGDHLPGVYDKLFEIDSALGYETPYFIYSNFDAREIGSGAGSEKRDLGETSPNYVSNDLLDYLDAKKSPWYYLLDDVKEEAPIVTATYFDENGMPEESEAFDDYEMIAYDMLKGDQYAEDFGMFDIPEEPSETE